MPTEHLAHDPFDALGDSNRRAIIEELAGREMSVQEVAERLPISRPAVSRHLRLLKEAGLVSDRADGTKRLYSLEVTGVEAMRSYMEEIWGGSIARFRIAVENTPESG